MLWGGVVMLIVDHVMSGEIVFYPPFLTAMRSPQDTAVMLKELATVGTSMAIAIFCVWAIMVMVANKTAQMREKKTQSVAGIQ